MGAGAAIEFVGFALMMAWGRYVPPLDARLTTVCAWARWTLCSVAWPYFLIRGVYRFFREDFED